MRKAKNSLSPLEVGGPDRPGVPNPKPLGPEDPDWP